MGLVGASPGGAETLKNLVLPAIGSFTIIDPDTVTYADLGKNFFLTPEDVGKSRAQALCKHLNELNEHVKGAGITADPAILLKEDPGFFKAFTVVIAADQPPSVVDSLAEFCAKNRIVFSSLRTVGYVGMFRLQAGEHTVVESKPESLVEDLRLLEPWPELAQHVDKIILESLSIEEASHVPWLVLLMKAVAKWKAAHGGKAPGSDDRAEFKKLLMSTVPSADGSDNYDEAVARIFRAWAPSRVPSEVSALFKDSCAVNITASSTDFWIIVRAIGDFVANEGNGLLPLMGSIPDMHATSEGFAALQELYHSKASKDVATVCGRVAKLLQGIGRPMDSISPEKVREMCKNAPYLRVVRYGSSRSSGMGSAVASIKEQLESWDPNAKVNMQWVMAFAAIDAFFNTHKRWPDGATDVAGLKKVGQELMVKLGLEEGAVDDTVWQEMCRAGNSQMHNVGAYIGGVLSQELVKLITHQWMPVNNTFVWSGYSAAAHAFAM